MKTNVRWISIVLIVALWSIVNNPIEVNAKGTKTKVYDFYANTVEKFQMSDGKLTIKVADDEDILLLGEYSKIKNKTNDKVSGEIIKKKKIVYKVDNNCKWRTVNIGDKFSVDGKKTSYKKIKEEISSTKEYDWNFGVMVYVKGTKVVKVVQRYS